MWGVRAARMRRMEVTEDLIADAVRRVLELGWAKPGQRIGITAGLPSGRPGTTSPLPGADGQRPPGPVTDPEALARRVRRVRRVFHGRALTLFRERA